MTRKLLKLHDLQRLSHQGDYPRVIIEGERLLDEIKNRALRRDVYKLVGLSYLQMGDTDRGLLNIDKSADEADLLTLYKKLFDIYCDDKTARGIVLELVKRILKYEPNNDAFIHYAGVLSGGFGLHKESLEYYLKNEEWGMIATSLRFFADLEKLDDIDRLFYDQFKQDKIKFYDISLAFNAMNMAILSQEELSLLINRVVNACYPQQLATKPLVEGFERKVPMKKGPKLKVGYLSTDYYNHPTMLLAIRVFELHNTEDFEFHFFVANKPKLDQIYFDRLKATDHKIHYVYDMSYTEIAQEIKKQNIHILVDLKGHTWDNPVDAIACRPAPIIVNWLGFPNTIGSPRLADYIITDKIVTPEEHIPYYYETVAYMPHCYQPNDNKYELVNKYTRADFNLPDDAIVFCSFNQIFKLNPRQFDYWCKLLRDVPDSVLWLLHPRREIAKKNLFKQAEARGVDPSRIIIAKPVDILLHRGRVTLADIALDSFPTTSHTTASDMLYAGIPIVAQIGNTFTSRVSSSIVTANNCSELIARNVDEAYNIAYALATNRELLANVKAQIRENIKTSNLYDSEKFVHDLEMLYKEMWAQYERGKKETIDLSKLVTE